MSKSKQPVAVEPEVDLTAANAEIQAEIQARFDASQGSNAVSELMVPVDFSREEVVTLVNLQANPMSSLGLLGYGESVVTVAQMADPRFSAKVKRASDLGLIMVKAE